MLQLIDDFRFIVTGRSTNRTCSDCWSVDWPDSTISWSPTCHHRFP